MRSLAEYEIDPATGFVPPVEPLAEFDDRFADFEEIVPVLSAHIRACTLRSALAKLPPFPVSALSTTAQRERALLLLTVFANGWVWGGDEPELTIPRNIAVPLCELASLMDRPPIVHYASMALNNWKLVDRSLPIAADNLTMRVQFLGGVDEDWFFIASIGVELAGAPLLPLIRDAVHHAKNESDEALASVVSDITAGMDFVLLALDRMREWCDPHAFYSRVRKYLAGWPMPGVIYEGVSEAPALYFGGSAAQSGLIQAVDVLAGIDHGKTSAGTYLRNIRQYIPPSNRRFIVDVENESRLRVRASNGSAQLRSAYNDLVEQIAEFRRRHMALAHEYIAKPSGFAATGAGTGGTAYANFLETARAETREAKLC
jgi:indoleamine 2,3-dioxygenase